MKIKSFTDLEQSKKLAEILPLESADQTWMRVVLAGASLDIPEEMQYKHGDVPFQNYTGIGTPCWSLAALLDVLPLGIETHKQTDGNKIYYYVETYMKCMEKETYLSTERHKNLIDACYTIVIKLHEQKLL